MKHSPFVPSASHRWIGCPGSIRMIGDAYEAGVIEPEATSIHAAEGTVAHDVGERALLGNGDCSEFIGEVGDEAFDIEVTKEMANFVQVYVDYVTSHAANQKTRQVNIEERVEYTDWVPDGFGTSDAIIVQTDRMVCIDLKYGKGVAVDAEENTQALLYALGSYQGLPLVQRTKIQSVLMVIVQPRLDSISEWEISISDLLKRGEEISQSAQLALTDDAPLIPGTEQCRWCPVKAICPALKAMTEAAILAEFDDLTELTPVNRLTDDDLRRALDAAPLIKSWLDAVAKRVQEKLESGVPFDGFKLVAGRSLRQWSDEDEVADTLDLILGEDAYTKKLLSPNQAEKALGKKLAKEIQHLITKPEGKPTMVPESDKRKAVNVTINDFEDLTL